MEQNLLIKEFLQAQTRCVRVEGMVSLGKTQRGRAIEQKIQD